MENKKKKEDHHHHHHHHHHQDQDQEQQQHHHHHQDQEQKEINNSKNTKISQASSSSSLSHMENLLTTPNHHNLSSIFETTPSLTFPYPYNFEDLSSFDTFTLTNNNNFLFTDLPLTQPSATKAESSEVVNTPNSTSVSSSSNEAANDDNNSNKETTYKDQQSLKVKKKKKLKKTREARFAFLTKSDIDNLDDGYRWRKYGQKAVKHSPYPRSYYRCTTVNCGVKKRVERSFDDPSIVMTTYEGQHIHPFPMTPRGHIGMLTSSILDTTTSSSSFSILPQSHNYNNNNNSPSMINGNFVNPGFGYEISHQASSSSIRDHGLLQDIVPSQIRSETSEEDDKK